MRYTNLTYKIALNFTKGFGIMTPMQDSYIGNTTASQAVKAGSTPVSCSKKKTPPCGVFSFWKSRGSRTYSSGTVRWTVPAPSSRTGCYHNSFLRMRKRMQIDSRIRRTPLRGVFFLDKGVEPLTMKLFTRKPPGAFCIGRLNVNWWVCGCCRHAGQQRSHPEAGGRRSCWSACWRRC